MESLKEDLFNYNYWKSTKKELFDITSYDRSLCENGVVTKQVAHSCLANDINRLITWTNDSKLEKALKQLLNKIAHSKNDTINTYFWNNTAPALAKQQLDNIASKGEIESTTRQIVAQASKSLLNQSGTSNLKRSSNSEESSSASASTQKPGLVKRLKTKGESSGEKSLEQERDGIFVSGSTWSVATMIKQKALSLHEKYKKDNKLTDGEFAVMSTGLSSIMDFSGECDGSQKALLTQEDWLQLLDHYKNKYKTDLVTLPTIVTDTWTIITNGVIKKRNTQAGLLYLYKIYSKNMGKPHFYCFKIFEHILDLVENYSDTLTKGSNTSENDYIRVVWSNILEQLFRPKTNVSVITGETVNPISTLNRREQYNIKQDTKKEKEKNIIGFKIDMRLTYNKDCSKYSCIDLCAGEAAKEEDKSKTTADQCKVVREAKDNMDVLLSVLPNESDVCVGWSFLLAGATCSVSCLYLDANGLYVNVPKFDFSLPTNIMQLPKFIDSLQCLLTLRKEVFFLADIVQNQISKPPSIINSLGRPDDATKFSHKVFWQRGTYYKPPPGMSSVLPKNLFGYPPPQSILEKLDLFQQSNHDLNTISNSEVDGETDGETDSDGWCKEGSQWYNVYTKSYYSSSPYERDDDEEGA